MDKKTKLGGLFIGGLLLASITSFPELFTAISAVFINNPSLAIGDILGSNIFNSLIISFLDIVYFKTFFYHKISNKYIFFIILILIIYILILITYNDTFIIPNLSIISLFILFIYILFVVLLSKIKVDDESQIGTYKINNISMKFMITTIFLIIISVILTLQANKIVSMNPLFSSSTIGAFLLGVTTSLPEVVSTSALVRIKSYNLAFSNIIGSNAFNFMIFGICDFFIKGNSLYSFKDKDSLLFLISGLVIHLILLLSVSRKKSFNIIPYLIPSLLILLIYIYVIYLQFS